MGIALLVLFCGSARAETIHREGLTVHFEKISPARAAAVADMVAAFGAEVEARLGAPLPPGVEVYLSPNDEAFDRTVTALAGGPAPRWALAVAIPGARAIAIRYARIEPATPNDLGLALRHELAHLALGGGARELPRWLNEGLAMWASGRRPTIRERLEVQRLARAGSLPRLDDLAATFPPHAEEVGVAYMESLLFIDALAGEWGEPPLRDFVARALRGARVEAAFEKAIGLPLPAFEDRFRSELGEGYSFWRDLYERGSLWSVAGLLAIIAFARYYARRRRTLRAMAEAEGAGEAASDDPAREAPPER